MIGGYIGLAIGAKVPVQNFETGAGAIAGTAVVSGVGFGQMAGEGVGSIVGASEVLGAGAVLSSGQGTIVGSSQVNGVGIGPIILERQYTDTTILALPVNVVMAEEAALPAKQRITLGRTKDMTKPMVRNIFRE